MHNVLSDSAQKCKQDELVKEEEIVSRFVSDLSSLAAEYKENREIIKISFYIKSNCQESYE